MMGQNKKLRAPCMPPQCILDLECGHAWALLLAAEVFIADENEQRMAASAAWLRSSMSLPMAHHGKWRLPAALLSLSSPHLAD